MSFDISDYSVEELMLLIEPFTNEDLSKLPRVPFQERFAAVPKIEGITLFTLEKTDKGIQLFNHRSQEKTFLTKENFVENFNKIMDSKAYLEIRKPGLPLNYLSASDIFKQALAFFSKEISISEQYPCMDVATIIGKYLLEKAQINDCVNKACGFFEKPTLKRKTEQSTPEQLDKLPEYHS